MNKKLPEKTRAQYLEAYHRYDARANFKYRRAVAGFAKKITEDESPDVLPLYTATFLYYAAGVSRAVALKVGAILTNHLYRHVCEVAMTF